MLPAKLSGSPKLEIFLIDLHQKILEVASDLEPLFNICAGEARFGASVIEADLRNLSSDRKILEIGGGVLLLSCHLQQEGYVVTVVEPVGCGFSHFNRLRKIVLDYARERGFAPTLVTVPAENLNFTSEFDFAFSINAMEHVGDVAMVLRRVISAVMPGGHYHFLCPNYLFPYEPHFNIPTLFSKMLTMHVLGKYIRSSKKIVDPMGMWTSLNWISVSQVRRICRKELVVKPLFNQAILYRFVQRTLYDNEFQRRRGAMILSVLRMLDALRVTRLLLRMPVVCQPAMDCVIVRP